MKDIQQKINISSPNGKKLENGELEEHMDPLRIQVQLDGFYGTELPKDASKLRPNAMYFLKGVNKLYTVRCTEEMSDEFEECILIRKGHFEWVELVYVPLTKSHVAGEAAYTENVRFEYPTALVSDMDDVISCIYQKFVHTDADSASFVKKLADKSSFVDTIEAYTLAKLSDDFAKELTDNFEPHMRNLVTALRHILFYSYVRE